MELIRIHPGDYAYQQKMSLTAVSLVGLGFVVDAAIGRGILLRILVSNYLGPFNSFLNNISGSTAFTVMLLLSSIIFIAGWVIIEQLFGIQIRGYMMIGSILLGVCATTFILTTIMYRPILWILTGPTFFNFLSFLLFTISSIALSRLTLTEYKGRIVSFGSVIAMIIAIIALAIGSSVTTLILQVVLILISVVLLAFPFVVFISRNWDLFVENGLKPEQNETTKVSMTRKEHRHLFLALGSGSLFLVGSGMAHQFLVVNKSAILDVSPIWGFLLAIFVLGLVGPLSDYMGRYAILIMAILCNTTSQILAILNSVALLIAALEIAGYYSALVFIMIKISDHNRPNIQYFAGVAWGIIFIADFSGFLVAEFLSQVVPQQFLFILSLICMLGSFFLILLVPNLTGRDAVMEIVSIISNDGREIYNSANIELSSVKIEEINRLRRANPSLHTQHVEFSDGSTAILTFAENFTTAVFVNLMASHLEPKVDSFTSEISQVSLTTKPTSERTTRQAEVNKIVKKYIDVIPDPEGTDIQFMV